MPIDFSNCNTLWASVLVETLVRLGLKMAVISPGSRSAPLAMAFAQHPQLQTLPILDERSAGFFALGHGRRRGLPGVLVCTSGTAGANFYPALIEARESRVPLLILTADRPPELRHCHAGQAIDQLKLFADYPVWQAELAVPNPDHLTYLRQTLIHAWQKCQWPVPGPVHLNCPFRDPLVPTPEAQIQALQHQWSDQDFFQQVDPPRFPHLQLSADQLPWQTWRACDRGLIIAGPAQPRDPALYCAAIAALAQQLQWPVLAEGLSPLRNHAPINPCLISTYAIALRNPDLRASLQPEQVIRIGELPTCKELRQWLAPLEIPQWVIDPSDQNLDATHGSTVHLRIEISALPQPSPDLPRSRAHQPEFLQRWLRLDQRISRSIAQTMHQENGLRESKIPWILAHHLPPQTPLFISNSTPVREVEWVWPQTNSKIQPYFNRGANGIDGILSTALGLAYGDRPAVLLTGDLAFLHDINGLLQGPRWTGHLSIVLINNQGGGIFGLLPIAQFNPPFEEFFATPQRVNFAALCQAYGAQYQFVTSWEELVTLINPLPPTGIRVLELHCDRAQDARWRQDQFSRWMQPPSTP
ncbi:2-succinyl-5-enolpyruvyl-6-hydroxy-3-cyclohexene-1-carboxylic-acid synthase [Lyngbya confervoides]|uniref:2-succinyl-5-enolpyruvyl-6-hydroxy-3-cyclohexene-1-carboxylate synthase n=1 Tax=Lyngbya confervoides BDU141951 TaxID=1574623 RepID=A0ABD4T5M9_9CYAN|nr:2-succinyl-5-enolpyruvyl-6-hydroxy-3-cyclohexene-1-carboxylic-acid synthase [Lyngbya confervoides]MCM1983728.1 2-succinyl-5-enolpyruvyl-6-hydroxy-3-cyclohexene-1-carboxylic-acid synthase [Lyngbya confervoides BDU141951]